MEAEGSSATTVSGEAVASSKSALAEEEGLEECADSVSAFARSEATDEGWPEREEAASFVRGLKDEGSDELLRSKGEKAALSRKRGWREGMVFL